MITRNRCVDRIVQRFCPVWRVAVRLISLSTENNKGNHGGNKHEGHDYHDCCDGTRHSSWWCTYTDAEKAAQETQYKLTLINVSLNKSKESYTINERASDGGFKVSASNLSISKQTEVHWGGLHQQLWRLRYENRKLYWQPSYQCSWSAQWQQWWSPPQTRERGSDWSDSTQQLHRSTLCRQ